MCTRITLKTEAAGSLLAPIPFMQKKTMCKKTTRSFGFERYSSANAWQSPRKGGLKTKRYEQLQERWGGDPMELGYVLATESPVFSPIPTRIRQTYEQVIEIRTG